ncbi:MAG: hypothetical protein QG670_461 [Thermoproteota archaeon]|nr:hypothetical protein [Thermoproteota archaeon]
MKYLSNPATVENVKELIEKGLRLVVFGSVEGTVRTTCINTMENMVKKIRQKTTNDRYSELLY